jgi:hypothetical protein
MRIAISITLMLRGVFTRDNWRRLISGNQRFKSGLSGRDYLA